MAFGGPKGIKGFRRVKSPQRGSGSLRISNGVLGAQGLSKGLRGPGPDPYNRSERLNPNPNPNKKIFQECITLDPYNK